MQYLPPEINCSIRSLWSLFVAEIRSRIGRICFAFCSCVFVCSSIAFYLSQNRSFWQQFVADRLSTPQNIEWTRDSFPRPLQTKATSNTCSQAQNKEYSFSGFSPNDCLCDEVFVHDCSRKNT
eukprot:175360_1